MQIGMIGLGRMGANMARRLARNGVQVSAQDVNPDARDALERETNVTVHAELEALIAQLPKPRVLWLMLPAGDVTQQALERISGIASRGDVIVDGGNAYYRNSQERHASLGQRGFAFVDAGVSGGVWGLENGYAIMLGGDREAVARVEAFVKLLAPAAESGWLYCGPAGAGHFVKMIHNGIEYGMMQAYAEGLSVLQAKHDLEIDIPAVAECWRHGSVVRSWLLDLISEFLKSGRSLDTVNPVVADSGEGRWTAIEAVELGVPAPVMSLALMSRFASQGKDDYAAKLLAMMRAGFGGHAVQTDDKQ
ncbi:MAG: decarboxylating 6-phosphogluconate dehydrogenase [Burkholderiales bacterium]